VTYRAHIKNGVAVLDSPLNLPDGTPVQVLVEQGTGSEFWQNRTIEELAREQGIDRPQNLAELHLDWPADESVDDFLALVREVRQGWTQSFSTNDSRDDTK
jgi:hypothetical protein